VIAITRAPRLRRSIGSKPAISACWASRLSVSSLLNSLPSICGTGVSVPSVAALSTSTSSACQRPPTAAASLPIASGAVRSSGAIVAAPPAAWICSSTASSLAESRATSTTCAPSRASAGLAHHLDDLEACRPANDRIVDEHDALAVDEGAVGIVLQLDSEVANLVAGLDEGPSDIVRADDSELEGNAAFLGVADRRRHARIGDRNDEIGLDRAFLGELGADPLAHIVDAMAVDHAVGPREIDMLEDAGPRPHRRERAVGADALVRDLDQLAGLDRSQIGRADHVERHRLGGEDIGLAEPAHDQRTDAERVAAGDDALRGQADQGIGALDLLQGVDEAVEQGAVFARGDEVDNHLGVAGGLEDRAAPVE